MSVLTSIFPSVLIRGYAAAKNLLQKKVTVADAAAGIATATAYDAATMIAKKAAANAITAYLPVNQTMAKVATEVASQGLQGFMQRNDSLGKDLLKGGLYAANTLVAGPLLAMPLNIATDYATDVATKVYNQGIYTAYNNYQQHSDWDAIKYRKNLGYKLKETEIEDNFILMSPEM